MDIDNVIYDLVSVLVWKLDIFKVEISNWY